MERLKTLLRAYDDFKKAFKKHLKLLIAKSSAQAARLRSCNGTPPALVSETASQVSECVPLAAPNRLMSLMQELVSDF